MTELFEGKFGISARVLKDSVNWRGDRMTTMEITYPRLVLAEINTHRMLSKNSSSSRAIPFNKMLENLTGRPVRFGANQSGMQDKGEDYDAPVLIPIYDEIIDGGYTGVYEECTIALQPADAWDVAKERAIEIAQAFHDAGYHKQIVNRPLEPYQMMKTVISGTEWANYFWLRKHGAADPSFENLAETMYAAYDDSSPSLLEANEYHLPYVESTGRKYYILDEHGNEIVLDETTAIKVSCARSCAVSFRNVDYGVDKSTEVYTRLVTDDRIHGSALEHAAKPMAPFMAGVRNDPESPSTWEHGITHADRNGDLWSGNLKGFIQHRKTISNENRVYL